MTAPNPLIRPRLLRGHETDFGTTIAASLWLRLINNHAWVEKSIPLGMVLFFYTSQTEADGTPITQPNPDIWQPCDGRTINDPDSPLNGQTLPDLRDLFVKGSSTPGQTGGQSTVNLSHNHGGATGVTDDRQPDFQADHGTDHLTGAPHTHSIDSRWSSTESVIPKYFGLQAFVRFK